LIRHAMLQSILSKAKSIRHVTNALHVTAQWLPLQRHANEAARCALYSSAALDVGAGRRERSGPSSDVANQGPCPRPNDAPWFDALTPVFSCAADLIVTSFFRRPHGRHRASAPFTQKRQ